jgi:hypothetical protein
MMGIPSLGTPKAPLSLLRTPPTPSVVSSAGPRHPAGLSESVSGVELIQRRNSDVQI